MRIVSPILKNIVYPSLSKAGQFPRSTSADPVVITYHGIFPDGYAPVNDMLDGHLVTRRAFLSQIKLLKSKYNIVSPQEFLAWGRGDADLPPRPVLLTCDDGLLNTLTEMLPLIRDLRLEFLFFVTGESLTEENRILWFEQVYLWLIKTERAFLQVPWRTESSLNLAPRHSCWQKIVTELSAYDAGKRTEFLLDIRTQLGISETWEDEYSENLALRRRFYMLNIDELRQLRDAGMTIGAHTLSHPMLSQMSNELAEQEITRSRDSLQAASGERVWALAFPFGNPQAATVRDSRLAAKAGFDFAFMNVEESGNHFSFPRVHVSHKMGLGEFEAHVSGFHALLRRRFSRAACA